MNGREPRQFARKAMNGREPRQFARKAMNGREPRQFSRKDKLNPSCENNSPEPVIHRRFQILYV
jgi:hypothetical protein